MDEDLILKQPTDRRLASNTLSSGPPGAENDAVSFDAQKESKDATRGRSKSGRRRSPSGSPPPPSKRISQPRGRRTPSPVARRRRSPSPRGGRGRFRDYSPERRRFDGRSRRSPDRRRSPMRDRDRRNGGRGFRGRSRSRTRSPVSPRRTNSGHRWSPSKKPNSPPAPPQLSQPPPAPQYSVMPPNMYGDGYATAYNQGFVQPPPQGFVPPDFTMAPPPAPSFTYQPPPTWGVQDNYVQQNWMPQTMPPEANLQMQQPPPTQIPQPQAMSQQTVIPAAVVPVVAQQLNVASQLNTLPPDAAPGVMDTHLVHDAAVAQEAENQRDELKKQRGSYLKKTTVLKKELKMLKEQRKDLNSGHAPPSPTTKGFIDENEKLQGQIQKKLSTIENVIDMLTGIIGEENLDKDIDNNLSSPKITPDANAAGRKQKKMAKTASTSESSSESSSSTSSSSSSSSSENEEDDSSPERLKHKAIESMKSKQKEALKKEISIERKAKEESKRIEEQKKFNFVFYDPEMHWCKACELFPKTAKDYLNHLHSKEHSERERVETPWHAIMVNDQYPNYVNAPTKRTPIRGLTFFVPATAWYCKLCNVWMGDLHCASSHLKSQQHSNKYNAYLEKNPHFEVDWLADRQRTLNTKRALPPPQQITSVSTTGSENTTKKSKKDEEKSKKRKKKSSDKKKKKKRSKKRKKAAVSSSSSSSEDSSSESEDAKLSGKDVSNSNPAESIRVAMRKQVSKIEDTVPPPPPSMTLPSSEPPPTTSGPIGRWTVTQEGTKPSVPAPTQSEEENKRDDAIISQWNTVQPVISESEKKLLEQLKGKLKNKPREEPQASSTSSSNLRGALAEEKDKERNVARRDDRDADGRRRSRSRSPRYDGGSRFGRRSRSRSRSRGRGRGGFRGRAGRRSRSRSRGRFSPVGWRDGGRRRRSRSRSMRRRSRSFDRRRRGSRSSRSRSRSGSNNRIEKPVVRLSEFRPRVPEKEKEKKQNDAKDKKDAAAKKASNKPKTVVDTGKKLPFIGKMPVFKKQSSGAEGGEQKDGMEAYEEANAAHMAMAHANAVRPMAPTAAQIQMAMMEDVYGNAPPFHPDASMMVDYDDLMPDPVQFVNIMVQAPPPPPPPEGDDDKDMLPPGIDETESEEFVPKPISDAPIPRKGPLPKDFEEALNIIFPGEKKPGDDDEKKSKASRGETQIIVDKPVMHAEDLVREGIHMVTMEETSAIGIDEASQLSMNEPLVFNNRGSKPATPPEDASSQNAIDVDLDAIQPPPPPPDPKKSIEKVSIPADDKPKEPAVDEKLKEPVVAEILLPTDDIPMPESIEDATSAVVYDLDDIPQPPPSPTESEKMRRQEELDDLAMLGIDASDMAAQCM